MNRRRRTAFALAGLIPIAAVTAASASSIGAQTSTTTPAAEVECTNGPVDFLSYGPLVAVPQPGAMPAGTRMQEIQNNGYLRVGIDENALGLAARDPDTGRIVGFEVDLARRIAQAILGAPEVRFVIVTSPEEKVDVVKRGDVDMTISVVTINCDRWLDVDFSSPYYTADQRVLVRTDSPITVQADLPGRRVCTTRGSSTASFFAQEMPDVDVVERNTRTRCLLMLQQGRVDAVGLPSSILAGLKKQDPTTRMLDPLRRANGDVATNTYGIAIGKNRGNPELTRFVNALLAQWRVDGTLAALQEPLTDLELPISVPDVAYRD